jgi:ankyrin repeat protein
VRELLAAGALVNRGDSNSRQTPLIAAAGKGHEGIVQHLLAAGARVDGLDKKRQTALLLAAGEGHCGVMRLLMAAGASVDRTARGGG